jgi:hypothetical protein
MAAGYDAEQTDLEREQSELTAAVERFTDGNERTDKFFALIERYENFDEISVTMLSELVEKIVPEEQARIDEKRRKREATKDCLHRDYLRRKENGKQKEYERKYEAKRKARLEENKAAAYAAVAAKAAGEGIRLPPKGEPLPVGVNT